MEKSSGSTVVGASSDLERDMYAYIFFVNVSIILGKFNLMI